MNLTMTQMLDELEKVIVAQTKIFLSKVLEKEITDQEAINVIAKVGSRIAFGKEIYDKALNNTTKTLI